MITREIAHLFLQNAALGNLRFSEWLAKILELADGEKELADGEKELADGEKELADEEKGVAR